MNKRMIVWVTLAAGLFSICGYTQALSKPYNVGYFEAGQYYIDKATISDLQNLLDIANGDSGRVTFTPKGYYSADWNRDSCKALASQIVKNPNVDMVLAAGPWVVEDLIAAGFEKPIVGINQFDPEVMGLVDSSGRPVVKNLTVSYSPKKIESDIAAIQKLFPSKPIGLLYFPSGDEFDRLRDKVYKIAGTSVFSAKEMDSRSVYAFFSSFEKIRRQVGVLYLPPLYGLQLEQMRQFFDETQMARIPTFVAEGYLLLEKGGTAANCLWPYRSMARFTLDKMIKIVNGAVPASLPTRFDEIQGLCLNLYAADKIGTTFLRRDILDAKVIPVAPSDTTAAYKLPMAIDQALRENPDYLAKAQTYQKVVAEARQAYVEFYPRVDLGLSAAGTNDGIQAGQFNDVLNRKYHADINVEQMIFSFPALKSVSIARRNMTIEKNNLKQSEADLKQAVVEAYLSVLENEDKAVAQDEIIDRLLKLRDDAQTNVQLGLAGKDDPPVAEERLIAAKIQLYNIQNELRISRVIFSTLMNRPGTENFILDRSEFTPDVMAAMVKKYDEYIADAKKQKKLEQYLVNVGVGNSIAINNADLAIGIQRDLISQYGKRFMPELVLKAGYSYGEQFNPIISDRKDYWTFGGVLRFPLFPWGDRQHSKNALQAQLDGQVYSKDNLRFVRVQDIQQKLGALITHMTTLPLNYFARNISKAGVDKTTEDYRVEKIPVIDIIDREENSSELTINTINDRYSFFVSYAEFLNALGVGYLIHGTPEETKFYKDLEENLK